MGNRNAEGQDLTRDKGDELIFILLYLYQSFTYTKKFYK